MRKLFILLIIASWCSCQQSEKKAASIERHDGDLSIKYVFNNTKNSKVDLLYRDVFFDNVTLSFNSSSDSVGEIVLSRAKPLFLLDYSVNQTYYIVYPNEKIRIAAPNASLISLANQNEIRKNELLFFKNLSDTKLDELKLRKKIVGILSGKKISDLKIHLILDGLRRKRDLDINKAIQMQVEELDSSKTFLKKYKSKFKISKSFESLVIQFFNAKYGAAVYDILLNAQQKKITLNEKALASLSSIDNQTQKDTDFFIPAVQDRLKNI